jgi:hypothetical protein
VDYVVEANPVSVARVGFISVAGYEFVITQDPKPCYFAVTNLDEARSESFGESGGDSAIYIYTDLGCNWSAVSDSPWISILDGTAGNGPGAVICVVTQLKPHAGEAGLPPVPVRVTCTPVAIVVRLRKCSATVPVPANPSNGPRAAAKSSADVPTCRRIYIGSDVRRRFPVVGAVVRGRA